MKVEYSKVFLKDIRKITDENLKNDIMKVIVDFKSAQSLSEMSNIKKMRGHSEAYRMRIGKFRLGFYYNGETVELERFVKRETIYKLFP